MNTVQERSQLGSRAGGKDVPIPRAWAQKAYTGLSNGSESSADTEARTTSSALLIFCITVSAAVSHPSQGALTSSTTPSLSPRTASVASWLQDRLMEAPWTIIRPAVLFCEEATSEARREAISSSRAVRGAEEAWCFK